MNWSQTENNWPYYNKFFINIAKSLHLKEDQGNPPIPRRYSQKKKKKKKLVKKKQKKKLEKLMTAIKSFIANK